MERISRTQRRWRVWNLHHLARRMQGGQALPTIARDLVGIHSSDPVSVFLALQARVSATTPERIERALYDDRSLARFLGMRRTMFVTPPELVPTYHGAVTAARAPGERRRGLKLLATGGISTQPGPWFDRVAAKTLRALERRGEATAVELTEDVSELGLQIEVGQGKSWGGKVGVSTRILFWLATSGKIMRARPLGSWRSTMYRWAPTEAWLGFSFDEEPADPAAFRAELALLYLHAFGPVTFDDLQWWTRWNKGQTRKALEAISPIEVELEKGTGFILADDLEETVSAEPTWDEARVVLLPALDSTTMGWKDRDWYLGDLAPRLFDRNGNAGPTVWRNGRVIGGWAQRPDGEIAVQTLVDVGKEAQSAAKKEGSRLAAWLGEVRFTPRFRTPLERELTA